MRRAGEAGRAWKAALTVAEPWAPRILPIAGIMGRVYSDDHRPAWGLGLWRHEGCEPLAIALNDVDAARAFVGKCEAANVSDVEEPELTRFGADVNAHPISTFAEIVKRYRAGTSERAGEAAP
jgi:hypothetical protein